MKLHTKEQAPKEGERAAPKVQMVVSIRGFNIATSKRCASPVPPQAEP
jgi:hypothetical protein